jgi:hypothetical protein
MTTGFSGTECTAAISRTADAAFAVARAAGGLAARLRRARLIRRAGARPDRAAIIRLSCGPGDGGLW